MNNTDPTQPIRIPQEPCPWGNGIYVGKEVEFTPVGGRRYSRHTLAHRLLLELAQRIPNVPTLPDAQYDRFTPLGRFYVEMGEFVEVAGPTCRSAEAVAWAFEMAFEGLKDVTLSGGGQRVVLCHTPSDYADYSSAGQGPAHSTGCHLNLLCPRPFTANELEAFAALVSPLNIVFGPGGLTWSHGAPQYSCDPRGDHVRRIVSGVAHGSAPKPFLMLRDEPFAQPPNQRLQVTAFGSPRSPVSVWLQVELVTQALAAVVDGQHPRWRAVDPIAACCAKPDDPIDLLRPLRGRSRSVDKAELAAKTVDWLAERTAQRFTEPSVTRRIDRVRDLSLDAIAAVRTSGASPPLFPSDIVVKRSLFDRVARMHKFADFDDLARRAANRCDRSDVKASLDAIIVTDILFSTPNRQQSTYQLANQCGLFVRPEFDYPIDLTKLDKLPAGISSRDAARAQQIAKPKSRGDRVSCCDWNRLMTRAGAKFIAPNPWSAWEETATADR